MSDDSRINIVLISSAQYNLDYFTEAVFFSKNERKWFDSPCPGYSHRGKTLEIDRELYERCVNNTNVESKSSNGRFSLFRVSKNIEIPIMVIGTSNLTFTHDNFRSFTIRKMMEADVLIMFYDKTRTGIQGLHDLIGLYYSYLKKTEDEAKEHSNDKYVKKVQPCLLIELIKPASDYKESSAKDVGISDQLESFQNLIINDSKFYHISLEVSSTPPDIYRVIESMILEVV